MDKIRVLHIITGLKPGGAEKVVLDLCRLSKNTIPYVVSLSKRDELYKTYINEGINTEVLYIDKNINGVLTAITRLNTIIRENQIQVIHSHMSHSLFIASLYSILNSDIKVVFTSHSFNLGSKRRERLISLLKPFRQVDIVFSKRMQGFYYKKNKVVIPNGINTVEYKRHYPKYERFTFLTIGRLEEVKNHDALLDIAHNLRNKFDFQILIVGEGYLREILEEKISSLSLEEYVLLPGFKSNIAEICNKSHAFVLPSLWEGLPISLLEAGASGLPVISTPVGSIPDLLDHETGYLSSIQGFMDCMHHVYEHYQEAKNKGELLAKKITNDYDLRTIIEKHEILYNKVLHG